jgi:hypothetical protein
MLIANKMNSLPQLIEGTGISADYWNEYALRLQDLQNNGIDGLAKSFKENPVKLYHERYGGSSEEFLPCEVKERILCLNDLAKEANENFTDPENFDKKLFREIVSDVYFLVCANDFEKSFPIIYHRHMID